MFKATRSPANISRHLLSEAVISPKFLLVLGLAKKEEKVLERSPLFFVAHWTIRFLIPRQSDGVSPDWVVKLNLDERCTKSVACLSSVLGVHLLDERMFPVCAPRHVRIQRGKNPKEFCTVLAGKPP
jgi:hypothetical protein